MTQIERSAKLMLHVYRRNDKVVAKTGRVDPVGAFEWQHTHYGTLSELEDVIVKALEPVVRAMMEAIRRDEQVTITSSPEQEQTEGAATPG